jgi:hypothetical protein
MRIGRWGTAAGAVLALLVTAGAAGAAPGEWGGRTFQRWVGQAAGDSIQRNRRSRPPARKFLWRKPHDRHIQPYLRKNQSFTVRDLARRARRAARR